MKKINLKAKKTEIQWANSMDEIYMKCTPIWFNFLNWVIIIAVFHYLANETKHWSLSAVTTISYVSMGYFIQAHLFNVEFEGLPFIKKAKTKRILSIISSTIITILVLLLVFTLVSNIQGRI